MMAATISKCESILLDGDACIAKKTRALFTLKGDGSNKAADVICKILLTSDSVLLKHEAAYVLGQMQFESTKKTLLDVLHNTNEDVIVRHEAGEALGNFQDPDVIADLEAYCTDHLIPLRETCILACAKIRSGSNFESKYDSYDPANPFSSDYDVDAISEIFQHDESIVNKYRALFYLRDLGTDSAIDIIASGFNDTSDLLKHEIAFVYGQMKNKRSLSYMINVLLDESQHPMVRHECAEAIGAIKNAETSEILRRFLDHPVDIIRESAIVALDIHNYCMCESALEYVLS